MIAFCCYFATFAIFFFTALYLAEVAGYSGFRIAAVFLAHDRGDDRGVAAGGPLDDSRRGRAGRSSPAACCSPPGSPRPTRRSGRTPATSSSPPLSGSPAPASARASCRSTSGVLAAVPAERSGMAASATNTSREVGAVAGVAVLGALVDAQLKSGLLARMEHLHIPGALQTFIIQSVENGGAAVTLGGAGGSGGGGSGGGQGGLIGQLFQAGYTAFESALHQALYLSAGLLACAAVLAAITLRTRR